MIRVISSDYQNRNWSISSEMAPVHFRGAIEKMANLVLSKELLLVYPVRVQIDVERKRREK